VGVLVVTVIRTFPLLYLVRMEVRVVVDGIILAAALLETVQLDRGSTVEWLH
tara:strand:- start:289 stop:444 length:156 start_codon:yes stop_codon:yes gene_type:complete